MKLKQMIAILKSKKINNGLLEENLRKKAIKEIGSNNSTRAKNKGCFGKSK